MSGFYIRTKEIREKNRKASMELWEKEEYKNKQKENHADFSGEKNPFYGQNHSEIARQKIKDSKKGVMPGSAGWNKGLTKETDLRVQKIAQANKEYWDSLSEGERKSTEEHKKNIGISLKGKKKSETHKNNMSKSRKGKKQPNISLAKKGKPSKNKGKKNPKISEINKETWANPETRQKRIEGIKRAWAEPNKKQSWVSAANKANSFHKINKIESKLKDVLDSLFPNEYKYTGDASIIIEGKIPDFININGQKKIIELLAWRGGCKN